MKTLVPHLILEQFAKGQHHGRFSAATACVDISGFTPLTEILFRHKQDGAEILGEALDTVFGPLTSAVYQAGGFIPLYAGDAFTAIFPQEQKDSGQTFKRTRQTAENIQAYLMPNGRPRPIQTPYGTISLSVKIGLGRGEVQWRIVGATRPHSYYFQGSAITLSNVAQTRARPGQIYMDDSLGEMDVTRGDSGVFASPISNISDRLNLYLAEFIPPYILNLPVQAEFRHVCPVFISVQTPVETAVLDRFILDVIQQTSHYGGYLSQIETSDKGLFLLLYFGAPISYENNVLRAARCLNKLVESTGEHPLWRAGFTYGLVWAGFRGGVERQEYGVMGDVVNSAARIAQQAEWGQIWLDEQAAERLTEEFEYTLVGRRYLKGREQAKTLYRQLGPLNKINITYQGRLIGRQSEMDSLKETIAPIFQGQFGGVSFVYGEAGMGKSRLLFEVQQQLGESVNWLYCPADEILRQSLNPFRYYLQNYFTEQNTPLNRTQFDRGIDELTSRLVAMSENDPGQRVRDVSAELTRTKSFLAALLNIFWDNSLYQQLDPKLRFENTLAGLTAFIQALALCQPVVIQFEDFHWFDPDSQQFLSDLSRSLAHFPAALILTSRYDDDGRSPTFTLPGEISPNIIDLEMLDRSGVRSLTEQLLGGPIDSALLDFLAEKSGGRPFFAEQLVLELSDQTAVLLENGRFTLDPEKSGTIPTTLNTLLISRLDKLPLQVKLIVQTAAVLGERFQLPVLESIVAPKTGFSNHITTATNQRIWVLQDELRCVFKHSLLRDAAYAMQLQSRRRELHRLAAVNMEHLYAEGLPPYYGEIAYHYEKAFRQGAAGLDQPAIRFLNLAAERAMDKYDNEAALDYLARALKLMPETAYEARFELHLLREQVVSRLAIFEPWQVEIEALAGLVGWDLQAPGSVPFEEPPLPRKFQARIAYQIGWFYYHRGQLKLAGRSAEEGLKICREIGDDYGEAKSLALLAGVHWASGQFEKIPDILSRAMGIFRRLNKTDDLIGALNTLGITASDQGFYILAWDYFKEAIELCENKNLGRMVMTYSNTAEVLCWLGLFDLSQKYIEQALRLSVEIGNMLRQTMLMLNLSILEFDRGNDRTAEFYLNRSLSLSRHTGNKREEGTNLHFLACLAERAGDLETAESLFILALDKRKQIDISAFIAEDKAGLAWVVCQKGKSEQAHSLLDEMLAYLEENPAVQGAYKPLRVYQNLFKAARALESPMAPILLKNAREIIQQRARDIIDPEIRQSYLTNVPENRWLMEVND